jgi:GNAT superfamily N-acetyltransferase
MNEITIRPAELTDLPILFAFEQGIVEAERPYDSTLKPGHINYYDIKAMIESVDTEVLVAVCHKEIVGSAYAQIRSAKPYLQHEYYVYLGFMFVHPAYRGIGVNLKIMETIKDWARSKGITELRLDVYNDNHSAIKAYEKAGFVNHLINMRMGI